MTLFLLILPLLSLILLVLLDGYLPYRREQRK